MLSKNEKDTASNNGFPPNYISSTFQNTLPQKEETEAYKGSDQNYME